MTRITKEAFISTIFIAFIMVFFVALIPVRYINYKNQVSHKPDTVIIDWKNEYQFNEKDEINLCKNTFIDKYLSIITLVKEKCSSIVNKGIIAKYPISELYCSMEKLLGYKRMVSEDGSVLVLKDGYFSFQSSKACERNDNEMICRLKEFQNWLDVQGIDYLYVMEPIKFSPVNDNNIYEGYIDYTKYNADTLAKKLEESNVNFLNLQENAEQTGALNRMFYKTDHHWKPSAALWASKILAETLTAKYGFNINTDYYNAERFEIVSYGKRFLGSQGKKVTLAYTEPDNFELMLPKYDTELSVSIPSLGIEKKGNLYDTLINKE